MMEGWVRGWVREVCVGGGGSGGPAGLRRAGTKAARWGGSDEGLVNVEGTWTHKGWWGPS